MKGISFKQYLMLRKILKSKDGRFQFNPNNRNFIFLHSSKYIKTVPVKSIDSPVLDLSTTGLVRITIEGEDVYHSRFDVYFNRIGVIISLIVSIIAIILSIIAISISLDTVPK